MTSSFAVVVVNDDVPATVNTPESVMLPALVSTTRVPPTPTVPKLSAIAALVSDALPVDPVVDRLTAPVNEFDVLSRVIV